MALKFKLVMRKNLGEDHESIPEKVYAQMVYGDLVTFDEFAAIIISLKHKYILLETQVRFT